MTIMPIWMAILFVGGMLGFLLYETERRVKVYRKSRDAEINLRHKAENEYHELLMWSISAKHYLETFGITPPRLPKHLRDKLTDRGVPTGPDGPLN